MKEKKQRKVVRMSMVVILVTLEWVDVVKKSDHFVINLILYIIYIYICKSINMTNMVFIISYSSLWKNILKYNTGKSINSMPLAIH